LSYTDAMLSGMNAIDWLLDSDPAIRWQVMRDLTGEAAEDVAAERAKVVAKHGWGARLLALPKRDGAEGREWDWLRALLLLRDMGLDPACEEARHAISHVHSLTWHGILPKDAGWHGRPFFAGEVEPCINGRVVTVGAYFGQDVRVVVDRLLGEQCEDGGWNCEAENGSTRGSFHTTICVLEGLLEYERAATGNGPVREARERGQEYLLQRRMLRRLSTGEIIDEAFTRFAFPTGYHYDVLRGTDFLRCVGAVPDSRIAEAVELIGQKRNPDGRWLLEMADSNQLDFDMSEADGKPSRWNTLRALRVLRWAVS
jgi:hypothetical protein